MTALPTITPQFRPFAVADVAADHAEPHEGSFADIVERLFLAFEDRLSLPDIVAVVKESREHLCGSPIGALPELTERLATQRLSALSLAKQPITDLQLPA